MANDCGQVFGVLIPLWDCFALPDAAEAVALAYQIRAEKDRKALEDLARAAEAAKWAAFDRALERLDFTIGDLDLDRRE